MKISSYIICLCFAFCSAVKAEEKKESGAGERKTETDSTSPNINLPPLIIPVLQQGTVKSFYSITLVLQAVDLEQAAKLKRYVARITDAIYTDLYIYLGIFWDKDAVISDKIISERANKAALKMCNGKILRKVVINDFHIADNRK